MSSPFGAHVDVPVERYGGESYRMVSVDPSFEATESDIADIVAVCNEPLVHRFLFRDRFGPREYVAGDAHDFLRWARAGWASGEHLVFLVRGPSGVIGACIDIGLLDDAGEALIGYWAGARHRGLMTNVVARLGGLAKAAGYRKLVALIEPENRRSRAVAVRAGFVCTGPVEHPVTIFDQPLGTTKRFLRFERAL